MTVRVRGVNVGRGDQQRDDYLLEVLAAAPPLSIEQLDRLRLLRASARVISYSPTRPQGAWGPPAAHREVRHGAGQPS